MLFEGPIVLCVVPACAKVEELKDVAEAAVGVGVVEAAIEVDDMEEGVKDVDSAEEDVRGPKFQPFTGIPLI